MDTNEIDNRILSLEEQCSMIHDTLTVMNHRGEINIPLEEDKVFRTALKKSLQKIFFDTDRVNYDLLVERIVHHLYEYKMGWGRSVKLIHTSDLAYQLKTILDEVDIPVTNVSADSRPHKDISHANVRTGSSTETEYTAHRHQRTEGTIEVLLSAQLRWVRYGRTSYGIRV